MKSSAIAALMLVANTSLLANSQTFEMGLGCRQYQTNPIPNTSSVVQLVFNDLTNGIWTTNKENEQKKVFQFHESGFTDILLIEPNGMITYDHNLWHVEESFGTAILVLSSLKMPEENSFRVEQTCDGIILTETKTNRKLVLSYSPLASHAKMNQLKSTLMGDWTSITYPFDLGAEVSMEDMQGAYLTFCFLPDGTYTRVCANNSEKTEEFGKWHLSKDGQYILFHLMSTGSDKKITETKVALLKQVDAHILEIEQLVPRFDSGTICGTELKLFAFFK